MAEESKLKKGDRVRVVLHGEVQFAGDDVIELRGADIYLNSEAVVSIEKTAPPLPTALGSVIVLHSGPRDVYLLRQKEGWVSWSGTAWKDEDVKHKNLSYDIVFDAGEKR